MSEETKRVTARNVPVDQVEHVKENPNVSVSEAIREGVRAAAQGEAAFAERDAVERQNAAVREHLVETVEMVRQLEAKYANVPSFQADLADLRRETAHAAARGNRRRREGIDEVEFDPFESPDASRLGVAKSPAEAAESLTEETTPEQRGVQDVYLNHGQRNLAVQHQAEQCGMEPDEFCRFMVEYLPTDAFRPDRWDGPSSIDSRVIYHETFAEALGAADSDELFAEVDDA